MQDGWTAYPIVDVTSQQEKRALLLAQTRRYRSIDLFDHQQEGRAVHVCFNVTSATRRTRIKSCQSTLQQEHSTVMSCINALLGIQHVGDFTAEGTFC